jgi:hypothetical protein
MKSGNLNFLETSGPLQACNGTEKKIYATDYVGMFYELNSLYRGEI